jgi:predicted MFS family arabinose efflux permease
MSAKTKTIIAACTLSTAGAIVYLISPVIFGSAIETLGVTNSEAGVMLSIYFAGYTLVTVSAVYWLSKSNARYVAALSAAALVGGLLGAAAANGNQALHAAMFLSGIGAGMLYGLSVAAIAESDDPDRYFGFALAAQLAFGSIVLFLGPSTLGPRWGLSGILIGTAVFVAVMALPLAWLPKRLAQGHQPAALEAARPPTIPVFVAIAAVLIWFTGFSGLYAFLERIGADGGLDGLTIGTVLSLTVITGISGALSAAIIGDRFGKIRPHIGAAIGTIFAMYLLSKGPDLFWYATAISIFTFSWNFWLAYYLGTVATADYSGRYSVLTTAALGLGATLGPGIAGRLVVGTEFSGLFVFSFATIIGGLILIVGVLSRLRQYGEATATSEAAYAESK